jgi:hypothetical protein
MRAGRCRWVTHHPRLRFFLNVSFCDGDTYGVFQTYYTAIARIGSAHAVTWIIFNSVQAFRVQEDPRPGRQKDV